MSNCILDQIPPLVPRLTGVPGADPENVEPGGANSKNHQTEPGGANLFFGLTYKGEQGGVRRVRPPLSPRLCPYRHPPFHTLSQGSSLPIQMYYEATRSHLHPLPNSTLSTIY